MDTSAATSRLAGREVRGSWHSEAQEHADWHAPCCAATDLEAHRGWARGQTEAVLKGEIDRLVNVTLGNLRKLTKARLVEVFANLKQGAVIAGNKEAGHTLALHTGWANGQTEDTLRGEIARIALAGAKAF